MGGRRLRDGPSITLPADKMEDQEHADHEYQDADQNVGEIDSLEHAGEEQAQQVPTPGEGVRPDEGGNEVQSGKARPTQLAHPHSERCKVANAVHVAVGENE